MAIIDSQVHAYEANTPKRPWHSVPNWPDHVTGDEMVAAMDKVDVEPLRAQWDRLMDEFRADPNKGHFVRNEDFDKFDLSSLLSLL